MLKRWLRSPRLQALLAGLIARYLAWALATTRWNFLGEEHLTPSFDSQPLIVAFWHECLPLTSALFNRARSLKPGLRTHVLISRHQDGRFIASVVARFGVDVVHGSSARQGQSKGGVGGAMHLLASLKDGHYVGITPDGPRGPRHIAAPGVASLAAMSGCAVLPVAAQTTHRWVLRSWDRMILPLPYGRGVVVCGAPITVERKAEAEALPVIEAALNAVAAQAAEQCV